MEGFNVFKGNPSLTLNQNLNTHPKSPVTMPCLLQKRQNVCVK